MIHLLYYFIAILITIFVHELGHMLVAIACGIRCEVFSLGFGKPYLQKEMWGIKFRISPWLVGGYAQLEGEKSGSEWIFYSYRKKLAVTLAGVTMNLITAFICYLVMYGSISRGMLIDWTFIKALFTKDFYTIIYLIGFFDAHPFLFQLSLISLFSFITNLLPIPALDGGFIWLFWTEKLFKNKETYIKFINKITKVFFILLLVGQFALIYWLYLHDLIKGLL